MLNALRRIASSLDEEALLLLYRTFILANFNYCPIIWHKCGKTNTSKLERLQHRALKLIYQDSVSSYEDLLNRANLPTLEIRRLQQVAIMTFKIIHGLAPSYLSHLITKKNVNYNLRNSNRLTRQNNRTTAFGLHSFKEVAARIWDDLPTNIKDNTVFKDFKSQIKLEKSP